MTNKALLVALRVATGLNQADPDQQGVPVLPLPAQIAALQGTDTEDAEGLPTDIGGLRSLVHVILGQPQVPTGAWPMSLNRSATRLNLLEPRVALLEQLVQQYAAGATATSAAVQLLTDRLSLLGGTDGQRRPASCRRGAPGGGGGQGHAHGQRYRGQPVGNRQEHGRRCTA